MFYKDEEVRTCQQVTKETKDILVAKGIKPGTKGIVLSSMTYVTVSFDGTLVTLREEAIEPVDSRVSNNHIGDITDDPVDFLSRTFGFGK